MVVMGKIGGIILLLLASYTINAQNTETLIVKGNELYKKQQFDQAAEEYQKASDLNVKDPLALYNLGNALYKSKKTDAAEKAYDGAAKNAKNANSKSKALYNQGVTYSRSNKLKE